MSPLPPIRKCPHGVNVGPLDDYGKGPDERVYSTYCAICHFDQTGRYPDRDDAAYTRPETGLDSVWYCDQGHPRSPDVARGVPCPACGPEGSDA